MDLKSFKKKFLTQRKKYKTDTFTVNPDIYWKTILVLSTLIIFGFFIFGFFLSRQVNDDNNNASPLDVMAPKTVSKENLERVIEYFNERARISEEILSSGSPVVDPSL
jgi:DNA-binding transcriptional regulator WhiA